jgi:mono/diheme cytochrome c family protein
MASRWAFTGALVWGFLALAGCGKDAPVATGPQGTYDLHCARCHAQAGEPSGPGVGGSRGPNLAKIGAEPGHNAEYLAAYIRDPKSVKADAKKLMPAFGDKLSEAQIKELAEWLAAKK